MNQAVKKPIVVADLKAIAARRVDGARIVQKVASKDESKANQWHRDHNLAPLRKMRANFG